MNYEEMKKAGGLQLEKNSVECRHNTNERGVSMPVPKEKRDYKKEYAREKKRGLPAKTKLVGAQVSLDKIEAFNAKLELTGDTKNGLLNKWIDMYLSGELD